MATALSAPKGTKDILPSEIGRWQHVEAVARALLATYRYSEIRTPMFEATDLFARGIGENTDIVGKEMYSFTTRGDDAITLRPENTAGVVRAFVQHKLFTLPSPQKLWYLGPMFRYERPQAGRQRQFHQLGVECLGAEDPRVDAETILLARDLLDRLGLPEIEVQINSVGCPVCRPVYRERLQAHLHDRHAELCENCVVRSEKNPLRVLDCKVPSCGPVIEAAPPLAESLCEECRAHLDGVTGHLGAVGVAYRINSRLVRGLDYYSRTVFEMTSSSLGAQNTVLAGGRYNDLVSELGGPPTPAVGWALGMERLMMLLPETAVPPSRIDALVMARSAEGERRGFQLAHRLRGLGLSVGQANAGKLDKQFKQAERLGARYALVLGEEELAQHTIAVKNLDTREQRQLTDAELEDWARSVGPADTGSIE